MDSAPNAIRHLGLLRTGYPSLDMVGVTGSNPVPPTNYINDLALSHGMIGHLFRKMYEKPHLKLGRFLHFGFPIPCAFPPGGRWGAELATRGSHARLRFGAERVGGLPSNC